VVVVVVVLAVALAPLLWKNKKLLFLFILVTW
jgi:hypothetical protein